jgi:hypothetical protein
MLPAASDRLAKIPKRMSGLRVPGAQLDAHEREQQHDGAGNKPQHPRRTPAPVLCIDSRVHQQRQPGRDADRPGQVQGAQTPTTRPGVRDHQNGADQSDDSDRDVDQEDPSPRKGVGEYAAEQQPHGAAGRRYRGEVPQCLSALVIDLKRYKDDRQDSRRYQRRSDALERPAADQHGWRLRESVHKGRPGEQCQPGDEEPFAAEQVAGPAAQQKKSSEEQRVCVDHPLQI